MIEFLAVAEFHEIEGAQIILTYPEDYNIEKYNLSGQIISEGLHKFTEDSSLSIVRTLNQCRLESNPE
jgi:hypothetical protein